MFVKINIVPQKTILILNLILLVSIIFQSIFGGISDDELVLCISDDHIALESHFECIVLNSYSENMEDDYDINLDITSHNFNDNTCFDIYLSNLDLFDISLKNKINHITTQYLFYAENIFKYDLKSFKHLFSFNTSIHKILNEYTTVLLLL